MSAHRDLSQKTTFLYTNFYHLYLKGKFSDSQPTPIKAQVLRSEKIQIITPSDRAQYKSFSESHRSRKQIAHSLQSLRHAEKRLEFLSEELQTVLKKSS